ncbi:hypothetical protein EYR36_007609 [Pleurotus pulmonarius]|nr:hypothetical protein EYR36_007609 [Pleurotus pulmonarius]
MAKHPWIDAKSRYLFLSTLADEVKAYRSSIWRHAPLNLIVQAVTELTKHTPTQSSITTHRVHEQVELFGQYAILSHRWGVEELSFDDVANLSDTRVQGKKGFKKLEGFSWAVKSLYGCRYLWMDTACIDEADRNASIPLMFSWYRHAFPVWKPSGTWKDAYHEGPAFDPKISFDSSGVMGIMLSLYPPPGTSPSDAQNVMFALMGEMSELTTKHHRGRVYYVGVLLRRVGLFHEQGSKTIGNSYNATQSTAAVNEAKRLDAANQQVGFKVKNPYPHYFGNGEGLAFTGTGCAKPNLREFPILVSSLYSNSSKTQGADRVVYTKTGTFCGKPPLQHPLRAIVDLSLT